MSELKITVKESGTDVDENGRKTFYPVFGNKGIPALRIKAKTVEEAVKTLCGFLYAECDSYGGNETLEADD